MCWSSTNITIDCLHRSIVAGMLSNYEHCEQKTIDLCTITNIDPQCIAACILQSNIVFHIIHAVVSTPEDIDSILYMSIQAATRRLEVTPHVDSTNTAIIWEPASSTTISSYNTKLSQCVHTAYTGCLQEIRSGASGVQNAVMDSLSYIVYALQIIRVAVKTRNTISIEKVFDVLSGVPVCKGNHALVGAIIGAFMGVNHLQHLSSVRCAAGYSVLDSKFNDILDNDRVSKMVQSFVSMVTR